MRFVAAAVFGAVTAAAAPAANSAFTTIACVDGYSVLLLSCSLLLSLL